MRTKKSLTKIISGCLSSSILAGCTGGNVYLDLILEDKTSNHEFSNSSRGKTAIPVKLGLNNESDYLSSIGKLISDIIEDPNVANEFLKDKKGTLKKYNCPDNIKMDRNHEKMVIALGSKQINEAIQEGNIEKFLNLCDEAGLLDSITNENRQRYDQDILKKIFNDADLEVPDMEIIQAGVAFAVIITVLIAIAIAINITVTKTKGQDVLEEEDNNTLMAGINYDTIRATEKIIEENPIFTIWTMKQPKNNTYLLVDKYNERQIDNIVNFIKKENAEYFKNNSEEKFRNLFKLNILNSQSPEQ